MNNGKNTLHQSINDNYIIEENNIDTIINNNYKISLLTKEKLENENTINLLQARIKNLNSSIQKLNHENEIYKSKINNMNNIIENLKIKEIKNESELNEIKKKNFNLNEELTDIKLKNKEYINEINKKNNLIEKLTQEKEERENKLKKNKILLSNAVKDYELYIDLNTNYEKEINNLTEKIKKYQNKNTNLENNNKILTKKISEYEKNIILIKSNLLQSQKNLAFMTTDKNELMMNNEKLKNDLDKINIEYKKINYKKNNIEEENNLMKYQQMQDENDIDILRENNLMLLKSKKNLDRNLKISMEENKQYLEVINQLKNDINLLQNKIINQNNNNNTYEINSK